MACNVYVTAEKDIEPTLATPPSYDADLFTTVHSLLFDPATNLPSIANIRLLHHRHTQAVFANAKFRHSIAARLRSPSSHPHAVARVRACGLRGAASLILCNCIPEGASLNDVEFVFYLSTSATVSASPRPPSLPSPPSDAPPNARPSPKSNLSTQTTLSTSSITTATTNSRTCGASPLRPRRHNSLARCVANHLSAEAGLDATITAHLHSSLTSGTKVDLVLTSALSESPVAIH